jgi:uncharacterized membrane protein AbrB (regulator of aidB expression)
MKMPIFKAMASITAWILFVFGLMALLAGFGRIIVSTPGLDFITAYFGFGIGGLFLSVVTMKLRKNLD